MAKPKKDKASKKALSHGNLYTQEAVSQFLSNFGRQPETDEVLKKAGIARHRLKTMLDDDEIAQAVETRLDALLATPFRIEPSDTDEAQLINQELIEWLPDLVTGAFSSLLYGYSVQEAVYEQKDAGYIGLQWIGEKPMQWFEPKSDGQLVYRGDTGGIERTVDQSFKFFMTRRKATYDQPYGKSLLSTLYWLYFFKQNGFKFWAKFLERFGTPILLGKCKDTDTEDMSRALLSAHAQSVLAIDVEDDVQILSNGSGNAGASFDTFNSTLIRQIQKMILGQTLTSGNDGGGSNALGEVHENVRKDKLKSDIRLITPTVQAVINALCALNGWDAHKIVMGEQTKQLNKDQAERDSYLRNAGASFTKQYFQREYGLQEGDVGDPVALPMAQQFTALPNTAFKFNAQQQVSAEQQQVDAVADQPMRLLSKTQIERIIADSDSIEDMQSKLFSMLKDADTKQFNTALDQALFMSDLLGFEHSQRGK